MLKGESLAMTAAAVGFGLLVYTADPERNSVRAIGVAMLVRAMGYALFDV